MRAISIGIPFIRRRSGVPIDAQAQAHFNRVIADGGVVPSGLSGVNAFFSAVKAIYGTSDINTAISAAYDPHYLGYRLGAGSGTTLGQAAQKMYAPKGIFGGIGTGSAYWEGVNVGQNNVVTPDAPANRITGDVDIICYLLHTSNGGFNSIVSKNDGGTNRAYNLTVQTNTPTFYYGAATLNTATATANITSGSSLWLRVTRNATNGEIKFFTSNDASTTNPQSVTWTQLGATVSGVTGALNSSGTLPLIIGGYISTGSGFASTERIFRVTIANSIGGTPVVDFNANQYTGANTWTSTTGEVWTVNSTGAGLADVTQTTAASQPLLLAHTGENYWWQVPSLPTNNCQTPYQASYNLTSYCDIRIKVDLNINATGIPDYPFLFGWNNFNGLGINNNGTLFFFLNGGGTATTTATISRTYSGWLRVVKNVGVYTYYTSTDGIDWTILQTLNASTTNLNVANQPLVVGSSNNDVRACGMVKYYRCQLYSSTTLLADFNPSSYNPATSQTQWTSATGEVWTINTDTATTGFKGAIVDRSIVQSNGISMFMAVPSSTAMFNFMHNGTGGTAYFVFKRFQTSSTEYGIIGNNGGGSQVGFYITTAINNIELAVTKPSAVLYITNPNSVSVQANILSQYMAQYRDQAGADGFINKNSVLATGVNQASTPTTADAGSNLHLFSLPTFSGNITITSVLMVRNMDNSTQQTAMYNALKSYNNGAF